MNKNQRKSEREREKERVGAHIYVPGRCAWRACVCVRVRVCVCVLARERARVYVLSPSLLLYCRFSLTLFPFHLSSTDWVFSLAFLPSLPPPFPPPSLIPPVSFSPILTLSRASEAYRAVHICGSRSVCPRAQDMRPSIARR